MRRLKIWQKESYKPVVVAVRLCSTPYVVTEEGRGGEGALNLSASSFDNPGYGPGKEGKGERRGREGKGRGGEREGREERENKGKGGERDLAPEKKSWRRHWVCWSVWSSHHCLSGVMSKVMSNR